MSLYNRRKLFFRDVVMYTGLLKAHHDWTNHQFRRFTYRFYRSFSHLPISVCLLHGKRNCISSFSVKETDNPLIESQFGRIGPLVRIRKVKSMRLTKPKIRLVVFLEQCPSRFSTTAGWKFFNGQDYHKSIIQMLRRTSLLHTWHEEVVVAVLLWDCLKYSSFLNQIQKVHDRFLTCSLSDVVVSLIV